MHTYISYLEFSSFPEVLEGEERRSVNNELSPPLKIEHADFTLFGRVTTLSRSGCCVRPTAARGPAVGTRPSGWSIPMGAAVRQRAVGNLSKTQDTLLAHRTAWRAVAPRGQTRARAERGRRR